MDFLNSSPASTRRQVLGTVRSVRRELAGITDRWDVLGRVFDQTLPHPDSARFPNARGAWRKRRPEEYPEAQPAEWCALTGELTRCIDLLTELREQASLRFIQLTTPPIPDAPADEPPTLGEK